MKRARAVMEANPHWQFVSVDLAIPFSTQQSPVVAQTKFLLDFPLHGSLGVAQQIQHLIEITGEIDSYIEEEVHQK